MIKDIQLYHRSGRTILTTAVRIGNVEMFEMLVKRSGGAVNISDRYGDTPLHVAIRQGSSGLVFLNLLMRHPMINPNYSKAVTKGLTPLMLAVKNANTRAVELLLRHPLTLLNCQNMDGATLAELSYHQGSSDLLCLLIAAGANTEMLEKKIDGFKIKDWLMSIENGGAFPSLAWLAVWKVRKILVQIYQPRSIFPAIEKLVQQGEIGRGIGDTLMRKYR